MTLVARAATVFVAMLLGGVLTATLAAPAFADAHPEPVTDTEVEIYERIAAEDRPNLPDVMTAMLGEAGSDPRPWGNYDLGASVKVLDRVLTFQARLLFAIGRWAIGLCHFAVGWVFRFDLGRLLAPVAAELARGFQTQIVGQLELRDLALLTAMLRGAWLLLRHRGAAGLGELVTALVIATAGWAAISHVEQVTCASLDTIGGTTLAILALGTSEDPEGVDLEPLHEPELCAGPLPGSGGEGEGRSPVEAFQDQVFTVFVAEPHLILQWGQLPRKDTACRRVADRLVARAAWDDVDFPRTAMRDMGCEGMADFNETMGVDRVVGAFVYLLTASAFAVAVIMSVATVLLGQVAGALLVIVMPFALAAGIAPGAGRELLGRYAHAVLKVVVLFLGSAFFLAMLVTSVRAMQANLPADSVLLRMGVSAGVAWMLVLMRRHAFVTLRFAAQSVASRAAGPDADVGGVSRSPGQVAMQVGQDVAGVAMMGRSVAGAVGRLGPTAKAGPTGASSGSSGPADRGRGHRLVVAQAQTTTVAGVGSSSAHATAAVLVPPAPAATPPTRRSRPAFSAGTRSAGTRSAGTRSAGTRPASTPARVIAPRGGWDGEGTAVERLLVAADLDDSFSGSDEDGADRPPVTDGPTRAAKRKRGGGRVTGGRRRTGFPGARAGRRAIPRPPRRDPER